MLGRWVEINSTSRICQIPEKSSWIQSTIGRGETPMDAGNVVQCTYGWLAYAHRVMWKQGVHPSLYIKKISHPQVGASRGPQPNTASLQAPSPVSASRCLDTATLPRNEVPCGQTCPLGKLQQSAGDFNPNIHPATLGKKETVQPWSRILVPERQGEPDYIYHIEFWHPSHWKPASQLPGACFVSRDQHIKASSPSPAIQS